MKRVIGTVLALMLTVSSFAVYDVGEVCDNISWIDNNGVSTSIYDQIDEGKIVMIFWGSFG